MQRTSPLFLLALAACFPAIPEKPLDARPPLAKGLPALAPCALVHFVGDEDLSNGARGWFRGHWQNVYSTFVIRHPNGVILIDAAVGDEIEKEVDSAPFYFRWTLGDARAAKPLSQLLALIGVKPEEVKMVLLTHDHWDHAGGLAQLPNARVVMGAADADWVLQQTDFFLEGTMPHQFDSVHDRIDRLFYKGPPTDGFDGSDDVLGDGSIIAVPTAGHTRGSTSYFVNSSDGKRWLFIGDAAWVKEGFEEPATKGRLAALATDWNWAKTSESLGRLHAVYAGHAATLITAHDARSWIDLPACPSPAPAAAP